jgi:hypothetical protein
MWHLIIRYYEDMYDMWPKKYFEIATSYNSLHYIQKKKRRKKLLYTRSENFQLIVIFGHSTI